MVVTLYVIVYMEQNGFYDSFVTIRLANTVALQKHSQLMNIDGLSLAPDMR
jgi:hypothetical protein